MGRWSVDALPRLQKAAWELFSEQGYEGTTVAQIAGRAGLTPRTFFRYFADKKEVLFSGTELFEAQVVDQVARSTLPDPFDRIVGAFVAVSRDYFDARAEAVRKRRLIIVQSPELQERETQKMARVSEAIVVLLTQGGLPPRKARLVADLGLVVFRTAFEFWATSHSGTLAETLREVQLEVQHLTRP